MSEAAFPWRGLGYVGLAAPDPKAWRDFATRVCGLMPAPILPGPRSAGVPEPNPSAEGIAADGSAFLKLDERQWRIAVHPSGSPDGPEGPGLRYLGFELPSMDAVAKAGDALRQREVELRPGTPEECQARDVDALVVLHDPAGHRIELFSGPLRDGGFRSPHGVEFKTGGLGMGHAVVFVADLDAALDFYVGTLGFERSDYMQFGPDSSLHFLRCTPRHHSMALLKVGPPSGLQHLMLEMRDVDQVGKTLDRALAEQIPIRSGLGRHRNDLTFSFYMQGPSGFDIEIGCEGLLVGDDWVEHEFTGNGDLWGHHGLTAEAMKPPDS